MMSNNPDGSVNIMTAEGAKRVSKNTDEFEFMGFKIPDHLMILTGAGRESWDQIGKAHIANYKKYLHLQNWMSVLEIGCGIGRDAMQLLDFLDRGEYCGIDVTRDSIEWCKENISKRNKNFYFHHFDAKHELYNPLGNKTSMDFVLPAKDNSVDRIFLGSVFTHLFETEVVHYMKEIRRVLKPEGFCYATFFLYSNETITAARRTRRTPFNLTFEHKWADDCYYSDANYPTGSVAYTDNLMRKMIDESGLTLKGPYLQGWWSGAYENAVDGQEVAILAKKPREQNEC